MRPHIFVLGLLSASIAQAYVPPSFFVIRSLGHKHANLDEGRFRSKVTFYRRSGEVAYTVNETLTLPDPDHAIIRLADLAGNELARVVRKLGGKGSESVERPALYDLLYVRDAGNIFEHLRKLGLPLKTETSLYQEKEAAMPYKPETTVALERLEGRVAVVVSDRSRGKDAPALWVEKDSFLPLRALLPSASDSGDLLEYRMTGFTTYKTFLYPRTVQISRAGQLWAKIETQDAVKVPSSSPEDAAPKVEASGELRDNVDNYLRWIR
jgi:hypothetical protein